MLAYSKKYFLSYKLFKRRYIKNIIKNIKEKFNLHTKKKLYNKEPQIIRWLQPIKIHLIYFFLMRYIGIYTYTYVEMLYIKYYLKTDIRVIYILHVFIAIGVYALPYLNLPYKEISIKFYIVEGIYIVIILGENIFQEFNNKISLLTAKIYDNYYSKNNKLCLLFKKCLHNIDYYDYIDVYFEKCNINFFTNKEASYVEYQINIEEYYSNNIKEIFVHVLKHLIKIKKYIKSVLIMVYMYEKYKQLPTHKQLGFIRLGVNKINKDLSDLITKSILNYNLICTDDYYDCISKNHLSFRVYLIKPCSLEVLQIDHFEYFSRFYTSGKAYILPNDDDDILEVDQSHMDRASVREQEFHDLGYSSTDVDL